MGKNILFIAYEFPPLNFGGVHRSLAFVKYLKEFDINPIVITLSKKTYNNVFTTTTLDNNLGKDVLLENIIIEMDSKDIKFISGARFKNFIKTFFNVLGNESEGWRRDFKLKIPAIVEEYKPEAIFVTVPPFSVLKEALWTAKKFQLPVISDFRDAWSQWRVTPYISYIHYKATLNQERKYLKYSDAIITTSQQTLNDFKRLHLGINQDKFHLITNGYDGEIANLKIDFQKKNTYTIGYVGSFYYEPEAALQMLTPWWKKRLHRKFQYMPQKQDWLYRSPYYFFKAIRKLFDEQPEYGEKFKIKFVGSKELWLQKMISEFKLEDNVELIGSLSHRDSIAFQQRCDALLITSSKLINGRDYSIAGKTFEYFKLQKPIIAFVCNGAQKDILEESGLALICNPDDVLTSALNIKKLFDHKIHLQPKNFFLERLSRKKLTKELAGIINNVIQKNKFDAAHFINSRDKT